MIGNVLAPTTEMSLEDQTRELASVISRKLTYHELGMMFNVLAANPERLYAVLVEARLNEQWNRLHAAGHHDVEEEDKE